MKTELLEAFNRGIIVFCIILSLLVGIVGYKLGQYNPETWITQNCFTYPFLLLDTNTYMACHRP